MGMRKYLKDYRLENVTGKNGKKRTVSVYCGSYYAFTGDWAHVRDGARTFALLALAQVALCLMGLLTNAACSRVFYVMVPFAFILPPLFLVCMGAAGLMLAKPPLTREARDHIASRTGVCPVIVMILAAVSAIAHIPYAIVHGETPQDIVYLAAALGICASALAQKGLSVRFALAEVAPEAAK